MTKKEVRDYIKNKIETETRGLSVCLEDEVCISVSGNTYPYRELLKQLGFYWEPILKVWRIFQVSDTF